MGKQWNATFANRGRLIGMRGNIMKKAMTFLTAMLMLLCVVSMAGATVYEYYSGFQAVYENQSYDFFFDLANDNGINATDSSLILHDVAIGSAAPLQSAFVSIDLFSEDWEQENVFIKLTAYYNNSESEYELYSGWFNGYDFFGYGETDVNFKFDISNTAFMNDLSGNILIAASITGWCNYNDFAITEVGIGGETGGAPIPEPATMLLLGTGLIGIAGLSRKKLLK
jgi:hypothetical protein